MEAPAQALGRAYTQAETGGPVADLARQLNELESRRQEVLKQRRCTPATVAACQAQALTQVLRFERRSLHDAMRVCAYTLNEALLEQFARYYANCNDIRQVLRSPLPPSVSPTLRRPQPLASPYP